MRKAILTLFATLALPLSAPAHHSFAMFDMTSTTSHKGRVKEVQWTNPHVWVELEVTTDGKTSVLSFEGAAISVLKRVGWMKDTVKAGDVVTVAGHPFRDGRPGGSIDCRLNARSVPLSFSRTCTATSMTSPGRALVWLVVMLTSSRPRVILTGTKPTLPGAAASPTSNAP